MKILIIGYSVTIQQDGYIELLRKQLGKKYRVDIHALGGANWNATMYMLPRISIENYDLILLEIATCSRWLGTTDTDRYKKIASNLVTRIQSRTTAPIAFLNFTREDIKIESDPILKAINEVSTELEVLQASKLVFPDDIRKFLYDGIHTKHAGAYLYASVAESLINSRLPHRSHIKPLQKNFFDPQYLKAIELTTPNDGIRIGKFEKGGIDEENIIIAENETIKLSFPFSCYLIGIFLKIGPETGEINCQFSDATTFSKLIYDERSYYERYSYVFMKAKEMSEKKFSISCKRREDRPSLLKGETYSGPQSISITGFFISSEQPPY